MFDIGVVVVQNSTRFRGVGIGDPMQGDEKERT